MSKAVDTISQYVYFGNPHIWVLQQLVKYLFAYLLAFNGEKNSIPHLLEQCITIAIQVLVRKYNPKDEWRRFAPPLIFWVLK